MTYFPEIGREALDTSEEEMRRYEELPVLTVGSDEDDKKCDIRVVQGRLSVTEYPQEYLGDILARISKN